MGLINESDRTLLEEKFAAELTGDVKLVAFTKPISKLLLPGQAEPTQDAQLNEINNQIVDEVASLSEHVTAEQHSVADDAELAESYDLSDFPAIVMEGKQKGVVRYIGVPYGMEFGAFIQDVIHVSTGETALSPETLEALDSLTEDVHIQVFSTPT